MSVSDRSMHLKRLRILVLGASVVLACSSCSKNEGTGGTASISGTIRNNYYNEDHSMLLLQKPAVDEEVFILYGEENVLGDRVFTGPEGTFRFNFLYPGSYYIYYKSDDPESVIDEVGEIVVRVDLDRGEDLDLGYLEKITLLKYDDGSSVIKGSVRVINYVNGSTWPNLVIHDISYAMEQEVYLTYNHKDFYEDRVRTQHNGYFEFSKLIPGEYEVFLYSDDVTRQTDRVVLKFEVTVEDFDQEIDLGEITIEKL